MEVQLRSLLGLAYFQQNSCLDKALGEFERCVLLDPVNPLIFRRRGEVFLKVLAL